MATCTGLPLPPRNLWPVGFRFHPTDEELINHYLKNKMLGKESLVRYIREVDICKHNPGELPSLSNDETGDQEWFFFCPQDFKYSNGRRSNRATGTGYWKSTGKDRKIMARGTKKLIGTKKTLVFYSGRVPNGVRTNWVIHEYHPHLDSSFAHLRPFVICRLKKKADEKEVLTCDEAEPNGFVTSTFENVETVSPIEEIPGNGQSFFLPDIQPLDYDFSDLQSPLYSDQEPTFMEFQPTNGFSSEITELQSQSATSEHDIDVEEFVNSILVDDENDFNVEELLHLVNQNQGGGFSCTTAMNAASCWQYDHVSQSLFGEHTSSRLETQSTPIIKESRRSPLTSKLLKYREEEDRPAVHTYVDIPQINCISYPSDDSDEIQTFRSQRQPKSNKLVVHGNASKRVRSKRDSQSKATSHQKENADAKHIKVVRLPEISIEDSIKDKKSEVANRLKPTCHEYFKSRRKGSSMILTTKCIHHESIPPPVYVAKAFFGFILFVIFVRKVLLYGKWW